MSSLWIVHRDSRKRQALARLAAAGEDTVFGAPADPHFASLDPPDAVLLGLSGDLEAELEFAHRFGHLRSAWVLVGEKTDLPDASRLFDALPVELLAWPPAPAELRRHLHARRTRRRVDPLSERRARDELARAFSRWFGDLQLPELLRALDPHLAEVPLLVRGEPGTGRSLLARYVHVFGGTTGGAFAPLACEGVRTVAALEEAVEAAAGSESADTAFCLCLENVERLPLRVQRRLRDWIVIAPPPALQRSRRVRFVATASEADEAALDPGLAQALAGLGVRIPPLRERLRVLAGFVADFAEDWGQRRGERPRRFGEDALEAMAVYPWPGNQRELEAVLARTLASGSTDPVGAAELRFEETATGPAARPQAEPSAAPTPPAPAIGEPVYATPEPEVIAEEELEPELLAEEEAELEVMAEPDEEELEEETIELLDEEEAELPELEVVAEPERVRAAAVPGPASPPPAEIGATLRRLAAAVAHGVRNPLVTIRTFAELLPERFEDEEFRTRFAEHVGKDVRRIERVVERLSGLAELPPPARMAVDVAALLDTLLEERRTEMRERQLLVLKELDRVQPFAIGDPALLRDCLESLLAQALASVPDRGDLYVASKHHPGAGPGARASVRVLVRFQGEDAAKEVEGSSPLELSLEMLVAETLVRVQGGSFHLDTRDGRETVVVIDLPAPPA